MNILSLFDGISCGRIALERANIQVDKYYASEIDKYAIQISNKNYPDIIRLGDVRNINTSQLPKIDLLIGGSPCFVGETLVLTNRGYKEISNIIVGDYVLSHTGNWRRVINIGNTFSKTRIISGYGNIGIETTDDHPFLSREMFRERDILSKRLIRKFKNEEWVVAEELKNSNYVATVKIPDNKTDNNYNFWYMIGRYTGDGWYRKTKRKERKNSYNYQFIVCCGKHEFEYLKNKFDLFGYKYNFSEERTGYKFRICNMDLVSFVEPIGKGASNKKIHPDIFLESKENISAFLDGLIESDGNYNKKYDKYKLTTTSKYLAYGFQQLISSTYKVPVSMEYTIRPNKCIIEERIVNQKNTYQLSFKKDKRKQDKAFFDNIYSWMPVKKNIETNEVKKVYNLEVEIDNSYTANNIVVHNCQGFSFSGKQLNFEDPRSKLFFEYVRILKELKPKYFLLENNKMKKEYSEIISEYLGVEFIEINSSLVSGQNRKRLYWTNIPNVKLPENKNIMLKDIVGEYDGIDVYPRGYNKGGLQNYKGKSPTVTTSAWEHNFYIVKNGVKEKFTPEIVEQLQTVSIGYTKDNLSDSRRIKLLGNGWTVDVITHILSYIPK